jgi:hypothetical protein
MNDKDFEALLKGFQFRNPKPLPGKTRTLLVGRGRSLAAAALAVPVLGVAAWMTLGPLRYASAPAGTAATPAMTLGRLMVVARRDPASVGRVLGRVSPDLLPAVDTPGSALQALSRE